MNCFVTLVVIGRMAAGDIPVAQKIPFLGFGKSKDGTAHILYFKLSWTCIEKIHVYVP